MRPRPARLAALVLPAALAPAALADTVTVGPPGSGADFEELADAVAAANPGDLVLVAAGHYQDTVTVVVDKPLTLLGAGSSVTTYRALGGIGPLLPLHVTGLAAGEEVRVAGLRLESQFFTEFVASSVAVTQCAGPVVLADVVGTGSSQTTASAGLAVVSSSDQVVLDGCRFTAGSHLGNPPAALYVEGSNVFVNDCVMSGSGSGVAIPPSVPGFDGGPAIVAVDSVVRLSRTSVKGGKGAVPFPPFSTPTIATDGGPAVLATASLVAVRGGEGNLLQGGGGGNGVAAGTPVYGVGGAALSIDAASLASSTSDAVVEAGLDGDGQLTQAPVAGPGTWVALDLRLATLATAASIVAPGATASLQIGGEAGAIALTYVSPVQVPAQTLSGIFGSVVLPVGALPLPPRVLDDSGQAVLDVPVPPGPSFVGVSVLLQTLEIDSGGTLSVAQPALLAVR